MDREHWFWLAVLLLPLLLILATPSIEERMFPCHGWHFVPDMTWRESDTPKSLGLDLEAQPPDCPVGYLKGPT